MKVNLNQSYPTYEVSNQGEIKNRKGNPFVGSLRESSPKQDSFSPAIKVKQLLPVVAFYHKFLEKNAPTSLFDTYMSSTQIKEMAKSNPRVAYILRLQNMDLNINLDNIQKIKHSHLCPTTEYASAIANELNLSKEDKEIIKTGATFHDFGKALIPDEVVNKPGKLTPNEKKIMDLHSALGYELLRTTQIDKRALEIVKNHHRPLDKGADFRTQIVSVADMYSALRMERCYKKPLSHEQAIKILNEYADMGKINKSLIPVLEKVVKQKEQQN